MASGLFSARQAYKSKYRSDGILVVGGINGTWRRIEGDSITLVIELDVRHESFAKQMGADDGGAYLHPILVPFHHLFFSIHHHPHLHPTRNNWSSSSTDALFPHHPISGEVGDAVRMLMRSLVITATLTGDAY